MNRGLHGWPKGVRWPPFIFGTPRDRGYRNFPVDADRTSAAWASSATGFVPYSASVAEGDLLVMVIRTWQVTVTFTMEAGWTLLETHNHSAFGSHTIAIFWKVADGTEQATGPPPRTLVTMSSAPTGTAAIIWNFKQAQAPPLLAGPTIGSGVGPVPSPPINTGRGQLPTLFLAIGTAMNGSSSTPMPSYTNGVARQQPGSGDCAGVMGCTRTAVRPDENPGAFGPWPFFNGYDHYTIAILPRQRMPALQR